MKTSSFLRNVEMLAVAACAAILIVSPRPAQAALVPVTTGLVLQLDASDIDADGQPDISQGVPPFINGQTIPQWRHLSGNNHATNFVNAVLPLYVTAQFHGNPVVRFDGVNDRLEFPAVTAQTIIILQRARTGTPLSSVKGLDELIGNAADQGIRRDQLTPSRGWHGLPGNVNNGDFTFPGGSQFFVDGVATDADAPDTFRTISAIRNGSTVSVTRLGSYTGNTRQYNADYAEVLVYNRALTTQERQDVETYLATKWATTIEGPPVAPLITTQPTGGTVAETVPFSFIVGTPNAAATYQWRRNGTAIPGATSASYSLNAAMASDAGTYTVVLAHPSNPALSVTSNPAILIVTPPRTEAVLVPVTTGLVLQFDASDVDADGTPDISQGVPPFSNGQTIPQWRDLSGNNNHATNFVSGVLPLYVTAQFHGNPVVRFDGVNDRLEFPSVSAQTIIILQRARSGPGLSGLDELIGNASDQGIRRDGGTGAIGWRGLPGNVNGGDFTSPGGSQFFVDGVGTDADAPDTFRTISAIRNGGTLSVARLGSYTGEARQYNGDYAEVLVYNRALTTPERQEVEAYLTDKWGTTILKVPDTLVITAVSYDANNDRLTLK